MTQNNNYKTHHKLKNFPLPKSRKIEFRNSQISRSIKSNGNNMSDSELSDQLELDVSEGATANIVSQSQPAESINQSRISFAPSVQKEDYHFPSSLLSTKTKEGDVPKLLKSSQSLIFSFAANREKDRPMNYEDFTRPQVKKKWSPQSFERLSKKPPPVPKQEDLSHCTFQPSINRSARLVRNSQQYYQDMVKFEEYKQQRIHRVRSSLQANQQVFKFKPHISDKSNKILELSPYLQYPPHLRLFKTPRSDPRKFFIQDPSDSFTPSVNRRSKYMIRDRNISDILYEDAVRRINKSYETTSESFLFTKNTNVLNSSRGSPEPYAATNGVSNRIIKSHFEIEFEKVCSSHNLYEDDKINYTKFTVILEALHLISGREPNLVIKLWDELTQGGQKLRIKKLRRALKVILKYQTQGNSDKMMQKVFAKMYEHRTSSLLYLEKPKETPSPKSIPKPQKRRVETHLLSKGKEISDRLQHLIELNKEREMDECTFVPSLNKSKFKHKIDKERKGHNTFEHLFSLSKTIKARKELKTVLREQAKLEEDQAMCTFSPKILRCKSPEGQENSLKIQNSPQKLERHSLQRSEPYLNKKLGKQKSDSLFKLKLEQNKQLKSDNHLKLKPTKIPSKQKNSYPLQGKRDEETSEPLGTFSSLNASEDISHESAFDISIHLGNANHCKLHLNPEASPEEAVENFSATHGLSPAEQRQLLAHVKQLIS